MDNATMRPWFYRNGAIYSARGARLLQADRDEPNTLPVERDENVKLACRAVNSHRLMVDAIGEIKEDPALSGVDLCDCPEDLPIPLPAYKLLDLLLAYERATGESHGPR